jgi:hypothetical protein
MLPPIRPKLLRELLEDYKKPDDLFGQDGILCQQLTKTLVEGPQRRVDPPTSATKSRAIDVTTPSPTATAPRPRHCAAKCKINVLRDRSNSKF